MMRKISFLLSGIIFLVSCGSPEKEKTVTGRSYDNPKGDVHDTSGNEVSVPDTIFIEGAVPDTILNQ